MSISVHPVSVHDNFGTCPVRYTFRTPKIQFGTPHFRYNVHFGTLLLYMAPSDFNSIDSLHHLVLFDDDEDEDEEEEVGEENRSKACTGSCKRCPMCCYK